jgi:hypothetical protein
VRAGFA